MPPTTRVLNVDLPQRQSAFLWGARKTGKSTYLHHRFPDSVRFDLLDSDLVIELLRRPAVLRERLLARPEHVLANPVIIDEVQNCSTTSTSGAPVQGWKWTSSSAQGRSRWR